MISWFTNVAAPYRVPIWEAIERSHLLKVHLLENRETLRREGRRPSDWWVTEDKRYTELPNFAIRRGERSFYVGKPSLLIPAGTTAVLIGAWESPIYWQVLVEAKLRRIRTVGFYESTLASNRHRKGIVAAARSLFFRSLDAVVVPGPAAERALLSYGLPEDRIHQGFNAVDTGKFYSAARSSVSEHGPGHRFVFVGQLIPRKNPRALLAAFADMRDESDSLTFIGLGEELEALQAEVARRNLVENVFFLGEMSNTELATVLHTYNTLVLPSVEEVWGLVVNEALAAGLGAVVSARAGVAESVVGMQRVVITETSVPELTSSLVAARSHGTEPVRSPEILEYTPERFASVFVRALDGQPAS